MPTTKLELPSRSMKPHLLDLLPTSARDWMKAQGQPSYRGQQLRQAICQSRVAEIAQITALP
ncbi:MAG: hypothetical protein ACKOU6_10755, partial [Planctomycetota bacterium]